MLANCPVVLRPLLVMVVLFIGWTVPSSAETAEAKTAATAAKPSGFGRVGENVFGPDSSPMHQLPHRDHLSSAGK
jgi:hypothetical protein